MASLGQDLKKQRESRNISLDEMASSTKIVGRYLQALEEDNFEALPGGFFIKGIIRTYAEYVGLDPSEVLAMYGEAGAFDEPARTRNTAPEAGPEGRLRSWLVPGLVVGAVVLLLVVLALFWRSCRPRRAVPAPPAATILPQARPAASQPADREPSPGTAAAPSSSSAGQAQVEPVQAGAEEGTGLTIDISFQEETWIQVSADGVPKISGLFPAGAKARARADKEILINVLGNAGGLTFQLNGRPGKTLGRSGEVINNIRITPDNLKEFLQDRRPPDPSD